MAARAARRAPGLVCPAVVPGGRGRRRDRADHRCGAILLSSARAPRAALGLRIRRLDARMQDTAEGFGQPIRHIFQPFFAMTRELPTPFDRAPRYRGRVSDRIWHGAVSAARRARSPRRGQLRLAAARADRDLPALQLRHARGAAGAGAMTTLALARAGTRDAGGARWPRRCSSAGSTSAARGCRTSLRRSCCCRIAASTSSSTRMR